MSYIKAKDQNGVEHDYWDGKLPPWKPTTVMGEVLHKAEERGNLVGLKYPLPKTEKTEVRYDNSDVGMWRQLTSAFGDNSNVGLK